MQIIALLINQQFRVTDDVDEKNVPDLFLGFAGERNQTVLALSLGISTPTTPPKFSTFSEKPL